MKKNSFYKFFLFAAAGLTLGLGSCKKYLDQQPITAVGTNIVFNSVENARAALLGVYNGLSGDNGYGLIISLYLSVGNDVDQGPTGNPDASRRDFPLYATTPNNSQLQKPYNQLFQGIQYANLVIANVPKMDLYNSGTEQQKKQLQRILGEALTLRAQFYFEAIRNWGDLPAHFVPAEELAATDPFPVRTDRDVLYDHILNDLKTAEDLVPWRNEVTAIGDQLNERITKGTVKGLRARIALFRGGFSLRQNGQMQRGSNYQNYYKIARDETNDIISSGQHSLNPSYVDLWKNQVGSLVAADPNGELMFQVSAIGQVGSADSKIGYYNGPTVFDPVTQNNKVTGVSGVQMLPTYFYLFDSTDNRRDVACAPYGDTLLNSVFYKRGQPITGIYDGKYRRDWLNPPLPAGSYLNNYSGFKWQILRYSDVLLMFAEAENELNGPTTAAYNAINMVRRRGYGYPINAASPIDLSGLSKEDFFKALVRERALELGGEGVRKFDLIRWNMLGTAIQETIQNLTKMGARQPLMSPSYMAGYPSYVVNTSTLPTSMYYYFHTTAWQMDVGHLVANSLYQPAPGSTPAGTVKVSWVGSSISNTSSSSSTLNHFATFFQPGKSELLPIPQDAITAYGSFAENMPQNPGY